MKHFGNSLSYEEIIEDLKFIKNIESNYTGIRTVVSDTGKYVNGEFIKTGQRSEEYTYSIKFVKSMNKWCLSAKNDSGYFDTLQLAKKAAYRAFGPGIKWKSNLDD